MIGNWWTINKELHINFTKSQLPSLLQLVKIHPNFKKYCFLIGHSKLDFVAWWEKLSFKKLMSLLSGSSHIRSVLIGLEYWNYCRALDVKCLFNFCYLDGANSIKNDLHICKLLTGQFVSYKFVIQFLFSLPIKQNSKK